MPPSRLAELNLPPLLAASGSSEDPKGTAYHLTIDANGAKHPTSTGISAHDRALAARLVAEDAAADEFTRPGHLMTLRYTVGGTRVRFGHTEAAVGEFMIGRSRCGPRVGRTEKSLAMTLGTQLTLDLCYLAGEPPVGLLCELVHPTDPKGTMARRDDCWRFAREWGLKCVSIADMREYLATEAGSAVPFA